MRSANVQAGGEGGPGQFENAYPIRRLVERRARGLRLREAQIQVDDKN